MSEFDELFKRIPCPPIPPGWTWTDEQYDQWFDKDLVEYRRSLADAILAAGYRSPAPSADETAAKTIAALREALTHAIAIIRKYVPTDALGMNSEGGGDGWNDRSWPILEEYLHYMDEALKGAALDAPAGDVT